MSVCVVVVASLDSGEVKMAFNSSSVCVLRQ